MLILTHPRVEMGHLPKQNMKVHPPVRTTANVNIHVWMALSNGFLHMVWFVDETQHWAVHQTHHWAILLCLKFCDSHKIPKCKFGCSAFI